MMNDPEHQLIRLASDNTGIYHDARQWFFDQGPSIAPILIAGLEREDLGPVAHWRILLLLREFALPSTLPAILKAFRQALEHKNFIVLPGAMEALAVFKNDEALTALISVLRSGEIDDVNHAAALLADWGDDRAAAALGNAADLHVHQQFNTVRQARDDRCLRIVVPLRPFPVP